MLPSLLTGMSASGGNHESPGQPDRHRAVRGRRGGMLAQVSDQADHVLGHEAADGAARVHAYDHLALRVQHEPGGLQVERICIDECAGLLGHRAGVGAVPQRECEAVLGDELRGGLFVVDPERGYPDAGLCQ
jgi:hypothetical protein